jgi:hypothetical protein
MTAVCCRSDKRGVTVLVFLFALGLVALYFQDAILFVLNFLFLRPQRPASIQLTYPPVAASFGANINVAPIFIVAGITSRNTNRALRDVIRRTWVTYLNGTPYSGFVDRTLLFLVRKPSRLLTHICFISRSRFVYKFVLGESVDPKVQQSIEDEATQFGDVLIAPCIDAYRNLTCKLFHFAEWATSNLYFEFLFKVDDDSFVRLDRLIPVLESKPRTKQYLGPEMGSVLPTTTF